MIFTRKCYQGIVIIDECHQQLSQYCLHCSRIMRPYTQNFNSISSISHNFNLVYGVTSLCFGSPMTCSPHKPKQVLVPLWEIKGFNPPPDLSPRILLEARPAATSRRNKLGATKRRQPWSFTRGKGARR